MHCRCIQVRKILVSYLHIHAATYTRRVHSRKYVCIIFLHKYAHRSNSFGNALLRKFLEEYVTYDDEALLRYAWLHSSRHILTCFEKRRIYLREIIRFSKIERHVVYAQSVNRGCFGQVLNFFRLGFFLHV